MPELPEVETVRQTLQPLLVDQIITDVQVRWPNIIVGDYVAWMKSMIEQRFVRIDRFGKYLLFVFENDVLICHLRMEGKFYYQTQSEEINKHVHVIFTLSNGMQLRYHDVRKFGTMELVSKSSLWKTKSLAKLGKEPFELEQKPDYLFQKCQQTKRMIKSVLLDQTILVGLGNIYVDEVLYRAKIHPEQAANTLSKNQTAVLVEAAIAVLNKAIALGGTTIRTYQSTLGVDGKFQNELQVHTKKGESCPRCGTIIEKIKVGGRGTYLCPNCQRME
ncbi:MAG: DNA-formamidopyrimidine glycosylase [Culicoidibacterales bacterium]